VKPLAALLAVLALAIPARAHRLDEYLQATRVAVALDRVELRIDLTPGVAVFPQLLPQIDPDANGSISRKEGNTYAQAVLRDLRLELDGHETPLKLGQVSFPPRAELEAGERVIRLTAVGRFPKLKPGSHELLFRNDHMPGISVYLVNALVPENKRLAITQQVRDGAQRLYQLSFELKPASSR
jgi:hypothetical protein